MRVVITQAHIDKGCRRKGDACPVFYAMQDAGIPVTWVSTWFWTTDAAGGSCLKEHHRDLPYDAMTFIMLFDDKKPVKPMEFEVEYEM